MRARMCLFQHGDGKDKDQQAHRRHRPEQALPRQFEHNQITDHRSQHRDDTSDAVEHGEHFCAALSAEGIAQNGKRHHVTATRANPLDEASCQEQRTVLRHRTQHRGQGEDHCTGNRHRLSSGFVSHFTGKHHRRCHTRQISGKRNV
ncbi:hypothetical protein D3C86_1485100 [compost metagenome]